MGLVVNKRDDETRRYPVVVSPGTGRPSCDDLTREPGRLPARRVHEQRKRIQRDNYLFFKYLGMA